MQCLKCQTSLNGSESFCPSCGAFIEHLPAVPTTPSSSTTTSTYFDGMVPDEIKKWNWGAFMFQGIWGIGNYAYLALLCFIPIFNFIWMFVCGFKGNEWAWKSGKFTKLDDFLATQETWNRAGRICFFIALGIVAFYLLIFTFVIACISASL